MKTQSVRGIQFALDKSVKVTQIEVDRLAGHERNLQGQVAASDWKKQYKELTNAGRTLQQLSTKLGELFRLKSLLAESPDSIPAGDKELNESTRQMIQEVKDRILGLATIYKEAKVGLTRLVNSLSLNSLEVCVETCVDDSDSESDHLLPSDIYKRSLRAWDKLASDLESVQSAVCLLDQSDTDSSPQPIETLVVAPGNEDESRVVWRRRMKAVALPLGGALIGSFVAGPVGFFFGAKLGAAAGLVGGGLLGLTSGGVVKRVTQRSNSIEMQRLEEKEK